MVNLHLLSVPFHLLGGIEELKEENLAVNFTDNGIDVNVTKGDCLRVNLTEEKGEIQISRDIDLFRAIGHISREGIGCNIEEHPCFESNGLMLDASRNGVQKPEAIRFLLRRMALMGLNLMMLYTEDTFEVEGYEYFGYQRGGYKKTELKALDDYAYSLGIEMIPCIQTLGHCEKILRWTKEMKKISDTRGILLVGEDETYKYIEHIMKEASEPYRSKRIHIGMDEAVSLGRGEYKKLHGERPQLDIFSEHINRVAEICEHIGLKPMIWSDMYFIWPTEIKDYDPDFTLPADIAEKMPKNVDLVYWDYYHHWQGHYEGVIDHHLETGATTWFAGGLWNWTSPAVNTDFMISTSVEGLRASRDKGLKGVFATAWNDCGTMCSLPSLLHGMQVYAEFGYTGEYNEEQLDERFNALNHADAKGYRALTRFNMVPGTNPKAWLAPDTCSWFLWEDPLGIYFEKDVEGLPLCEHYRELHSDCEYYYGNAEAPEQKRMWEFYTRLADILHKKAYWRDNAPIAVRNHDLKLAAEMADFADKLIPALEEFHECWYQCWHADNSDYGWDVIDLRVGGLIARMKTAARTMHDFANGKIPTIPQLAEKKLCYTNWEQGHPTLFANFIGAMTNQDL